MRQRRKPFLSICIPTYNREDYIGYTIESLEPGENTDVEIVICDDASTDGSPKILKQYQRKFPNISLYLNKKNLGFDKNMIKVVKKARGEYCWYLGDDDYLRVGAIKKIISLIEKKKPALIMTNFARFDNKKQKFTAKRMIEGASEEFSDAQAFFFQRTKNSYFPFLGVNLIYISILIFRRNFWHAAVKAIPQKYLESNFFHKFTMTKLIEDHPNLVYFSDPIVVYRDKNIRRWGNPDIWGYYVNTYLPFTLTLGWNPLRVKYAQWVISIHNSPKSGLIAKMRDKVYAATGFMKTSLGSHRK